MPAATWPYRPADAHHVELVEVRGRDRQEAQALEQRVAHVLRLLQHAAVELQPGQLAVVEARRTGRRRHRRRRPCCAVRFLELRLRRSHGRPSRTVASRAQRRGNCATCAHGTEGTSLQQQDEVWWRPAQFRYRSLPPARLPRPARGSPCGARPWPAGRSRPRCVGRGLHGLLHMQRDVARSRAAPRTSCRSVNCLTSTALSRASSGGCDGDQRQRPQARAQVGQARRRARPAGTRGRQQHGQLVLAHQVEEMEQHALVGDAGVQVLDQQRPLAGRTATSASPRRGLPAAPPPDFRRQTLARCVLPAPAGATTSDARRAASPASGRRCRRPPGWTG